MLTSKLAILILGFPLRTQLRVLGEAGREADWLLPSTSSHFRGPWAACCRRQGNDLTRSPAIGSLQRERKGPSQNAFTTGRDTSTCQGQEQQRNDLGKEGTAAESPAAAQLLKAAPLQVALGEGVGHPAARGRPPPARARPACAGASLVLIG